jgi:probable addiction module antidote protein
MVKPRSFDAAKYRDNPKAIAAYLNKALLSRDSNLVSLAIRDMARVQGMTRFARKAGMRRESLYKSFGGTSSPAFNMVFNVLIALDVRLIVRADRASITFDDFERKARKMTPGRVERSG